MINSCYSCINYTHQFYLQAESFIKLHQKRLIAISAIAIGILCGLAGSSLQRLNPPLELMFYAISFFPIVYAINLLAPVKSGQIGNTDSSDFSFSSVDFTDSDSSYSRDEEWTDFSD